MSEKLANFFIKLFGATAGGLLSKYIVVFIISMIPILELRGGLIAASLLNLPVIPSSIICFIGNLIPIPFILWFINPIFRKMKNLPFLGKIVKWCEEKAKSKKTKIENLKYLGLILFVGVPVPGTGAWMGSLIAALLNMDKKKSLLSIIVGLLMASIIMIIVSYGVIGRIV